MYLDIDSTYTIELRDNTEFTGLFNGNLRREPDGLWLAEFNLAGRLAIKLIALDDIKTITIEE